MMRHGRKKISDFQDTAIEIPKMKQREKKESKKLKKHQWSVEKFKWPNIQVIKVLKEE